MFSILKTLFGKASQEAYPEAVIKQAIERTVDATDPWLRAVSGYQKKLRPAVIRSIDHVVAMVDSLPPPVTVNFACYDDNAVLRSYFISAKEMQDIFSRDPKLIEFMKGGGDGSVTVTAMLVMERQERVVFGAALSGDIVIRDVPMETVSFYGHRLIDPSVDEAITRRALKIRAFEHLVSLALKRLIFLKAERSDLKRRRTLLQAKLYLFQRQGWGFDPLATSGLITPEELEIELASIEGHLKELGGDSNEIEVYLQLIIDVMGNPEEYLLAKNEKMFVNKLGVKQYEAASDARELTFSELYNAEGLRLVVMPVALDTGELRRLMTAL